MIDKFRKDNIWMGIILGILLPVITFGIFYGILYLVELKTGKIDFISVQKILLLAIIPNILLLRYYLLKLKYDLTGRGIVTATFLYAILFALLEFAV
ncbi:MAG: hypothetical protein LBU51_05675 [Bacteroidales bacterium]|jgi:hypothetical protein|nr:hypothetical protein [Bacteroidales bacterium]